MTTKSKTGEIPRGALRTVVLALLAEEPSHGYRLCRTLEARTDGKFTFSEGSLYPLLHELELEGFVTVKETTSPNGRKRRVYHLTRSGRRQTERHRNHWLATAQLIISLLSPAEVAAERGRG